MADLAGELAQLAGGGLRGTAVSAVRFWPAVVCGLAVPGTLDGSGSALGLLLAGAGGVALSTYADRRLAGRQDRP